MAKRPYFVVSDIDTEVYFFEEHVDFQFYNGFSSENKKKSIESLHNAIISESNHLKPLEISTKSSNELGKMLSAFNLKLLINGSYYPIECVYQSSKVFENGGPYLDLLYKDPYEVKKDERLKNSGEIISFSFENKIFPNLPRNYFYDYIYIKALSSSDFNSDLLEYNVFTDIEFNPKKSLNCQARSVALFIRLFKKKEVNKFLDDPSFAKKIYKETKGIEFEQISLI